MNRYAATSFVNRKIYELKLEDLVWTSLVCGGMVMKIYYEDNHWDALPEDFAEAMKGVNTAQDFLQTLHSVMLQKNLVQYSPPS